MDNALRYLITSMLHPMHHGMVHMHVLLLCGALHVPMLGAYAPSIVHMHGQWVVHAGVSKGA